MNLWGWSCLVLAATAIAVPGCLLVQPLDGAKSDPEGGTTSAGGTMSAGGRASGHAGSKPSGDSGDTGLGGDGEAGDGPSPGGGSGGSGPTPSGGRGGAHAGGAPSTTGGSPSGVDFSYFTGTWTTTSGTVTTDCGKGPVDKDLGSGSMDTLTVGTTSDLIVDEGTDCPLLADVSDLVALGQDGQTCDFTDTTGDTYHLDIDDFNFIVDDDHQTASSYLKSVVTETSGGVTTVCDSEQYLYYER